jgi:ABC-type sugar transport system permease subunit
MLLPTAAVLVLFVFYPVIVAIKTSFVSWDLLTPPKPVGFANYTALVESGELGHVALRTVLFSAIVVVLSVSLGLALAVALSKKTRLFAFVRSAIFSAYVVSWVAVGLLFTYLLGGGGPLATLIHGGGGDPRGLLGDPDTALVALALVAVWKIAGYAMVLFLAGLQDIPASVLEAAALDGATPVRRFFRITLPLLRPTLAFVTTTSLIVSFQAFDIVRVMTQGGPVHATTIFVYAIYEAIFLNLRVGRASALVVVYLALLLVLTAVQLRFFRKVTARKEAER